MNRTLPTDSAARKDVPMFAGLLAYFPAALAAVARWSKLGNDKHNPGEPLHHARGKSMDHRDCIVRHLVDLAELEAQGRGFTPWEPTAECRAAIRDEAAALAWRALALSQELHERYGDAPLAPGAQLPEPTGEFPVRSSGQHPSLAGLDWGDSPRSYRHTSYDAYGRKI